MRVINSYNKGVLGELRAAMQLRLQGYRILHERYKTRFGEVDIIAQKGDLVIFVEVKSHKTIEAALAAVSARSRRRIEQSALYFLSQYPIYNDHDLRFDVVVFCQGSIWGQHLDNAWLLGA